MHTIRTTLNILLIQAALLFVIALFPAGETFAQTQLTPRPYLARISPGGNVVGSVFQPAQGYLWRGGGTPRTLPVVGQTGDRLYDLNSSGEGIGALSFRGFAQGLMQIGVLFSVSSIANPFGYEYIAPLHPDGLLSLVQVNNSTPRLAIGTSWDQNASNPRGMVFISGVGTIDLNDLVSTGLLSGEIITSAQAVNDNFEIVAHTTHGRALFIDPFAASAVELVAPPNFAAAVSDMNNSGLMVGRVFPQGGATLHNAMVWDRFGNGVALQSSIAGVNYSHTEATTITESGLILGSVSTSIAPNSSLAFIWSSNGNALNFLNQVVSLAPGFTPVSFMDGVDDPAVAGGVRYLVEGLVGGAQLTEVYTIP